MENIFGKVIRILDKRTVIINLGKEAGVSSSSFFSIMGEPEQIIDPETNKILGEVTIVKSRVKAKEVATKFTIATTKWESRKFKGGSSIFSALANAVEIETIKNDEGELLVDESDIKPWKAKSESPVRIGDVVQVLIENEPEQKAELPQPDKDVSENE